MGKPGTVAFRYPSTKDEMPAGPYAEAGLLVDVNAGWRSLRPVIDHARCTRCMRCWQVCPDGAVDRTGQTYAIDLDFCKGCGLCAFECRPKAIAMVREGEAAGV